MVRSAVDGDGECRAGGLARHSEFGVVGVGGVAVGVMAGTEKFHCFNVGASPVFVWWVMVGVEALAGSNASFCGTSAVLANGHRQFLQWRRESS